MQTPRTLQLHKGVVEDLLLRLVLSKRSRHLLDHRLGELALLALALLRLVADPAVKHRLELRRNLRALLELKGLLLRTDGFLWSVYHALETYAGHFVERLGHINDVLLLAHSINAVLHSLSVLRAGIVEDTSHFLA